MSSPPSPIVMALSGNDPTGGAGIQADIEAIASMGCHAAPVITCLTQQDTHNVQAVLVSDPETVIRQAETVLADMPIDVFKVGLLGSAEMASALAALFARHNHIPVILDPILAAGGGTELATTALIDTLKHQLLPLTTILTPNLPEAQTLTKEEAPDACGLSLLAMGCDYVFITGTHENEHLEDSRFVINRAYGNDSIVEQFMWPRLPHSYHGSGCTLTSAIAGKLASGLTPLDAYRQAQEYAWQSLKQGQALGQGQWIPNRLFWAHNKDND